MRQALASSGYELGRVNSFLCNAFVVASRASVVQITIFCYSSRGENAARGASRSFPRRAVTDTRKWSSLTFTRMALISTFWS